MTEVEQHQTNGIETIVEDENSKVRPADIEAVMQSIQNSTCFSELFLTCVFSFLSLFI